MSKGSRLYKTFMTSMIVIIAGLLLATGIIAIQKHIKLKANIQFLPGVNVEIYVNEESENGLLFRNFDKDTNNKIYVNSTYCELGATTLTMNNNFVTAYGNNFTLIVKNYSDFTIETKITSTATAKIGENSVNALPAQITPATSQIVSNASGEFVVSCEPIIPQTTTISLSFEEVVPGGGSDSGDSTGGNSGGSDSGDSSGDNSGGSGSGGGSEGSGGTGGSGSGNDDEDGNDVPYTIKTYNTTNVTTNYNSAWAGYSYIEFGEYPQTLATETVTLTSGTENTTGAIGTGASGAKYYYQSDVNGYGTSGWYKFEPIRWIVIAASSDIAGQCGAGSSITKDVTGTKQLLLLSEFGLYREYFAKESSYTNQFGSSDCEVQTSLNDSFAKMAGLYNYFEDDDGVSEDNEFIAQVTPGTTYADSSNNEQFDSTSSYNMFLLGRANGSDSNVDTYHWDEYMDEGSEQMQCVPTAFAKTTGVYHDSVNDASSWWLRSGFSTNYRAYDVNYAGNLRNIMVYNPHHGVRPCFILNLA